MGNYSFKTTGLPEPVGGVLERHNFHQAVPHTKIYEGYAGLTFRMCNLTNCDVPSGSVIDSCLVSQISYCSHLHPEWSAFLSQCTNDCSHRSVVDTVTVDGVTVDSNNTYEDLVVA